MAWSPPMMSMSGSFQDPGPAMSAKPSEVLEASHLQERQTQPWQPFYQRCFSRCSARGRLPLTST